MDVNSTIAFGRGPAITFGGLIAKRGDRFDVYLYGGGGLASGGGVSLTWSPSAPTPGLTVGLQVQLFIAGQLGYSFGRGGGPFVEVGGGYPPGGSVTVYFVAEPIEIGRVEVTPIITSLPGLGGVLAW